MGTVLTESGDPVFGARVALGGAGAVSDAEGRFVLDRPARDGLAVVTTSGAYGYTPVDAHGSEPLQVTVHPAPVTADTLRFGGEVRTGRSLLPRSADTEAYVGALAGVEPLLSMAEASAVTLAGPLLPDPWRDQRDASSGRLADALATTGVDVVNLATDRILDAGRPAVATTLEILDEAGLAAAGAGPDLARAWAPAVIEAGQQRVAYVGCQVGAADAPWAATRDRAGAAPCTPGPMQRAIRTAGRDADSVVVFVRDDRPYARSVGDTFARRVKAAVRAGATVIVGGGTHVAGEVWDFGNATAVQSLGDLLTDDPAWQTRDGFLLRTDVDGVQAVSVSAEPLTRSNGVPSMVTGELAQEISRIAAADIDDGPLVLADDMAVVSLDTWTVDQTTVPARVDDEGAPLELESGWWLPPAGQQGVTAGYDLTPTGTFEDIDSDPATDGAIGWFLSPGAELVRADQTDQTDQTDSVCQGSVAVRMTSAGDRPATLFPAGTIPTDRVRGMTVSMAVDAEQRPLTGRLTLQWLDGGTVVGEDSVPLGSARGPCDVLRLDTIPPEGADSVRPLVSVQRGTAVVDDLHVVAWEPGRAGGRRYSRIRVFEPVQVTLVVDVPRGAPTPAGPFTAESTGSRE
ncbi:CapA family protein [Nocardioidaceae bacterium]|nr:CapA family protein [Nocardioidaceae bacterium]